MAIRHQTVEIKILITQPAVLLLNRSEFDIKIPANLSNNRREIDSISPRKVTKYRNSDIEFTAILNEITNC
jgi:hypothetical protein